MPWEESEGAPSRLRGALCGSQFPVLCSKPGCAALRVLLPAPSRPRTCSLVLQRADCCMICHEQGPNIATLCCGAAVHLNCMAKWLADAPQPSCIRSYLDTQLRMYAHVRHVPCSSSSSLPQRRVQLLRPSPHYR